MPRKRARKADLPRRKAAIWDALAQGDPDAPALQARAIPTGAPPKPRNDAERREVQRPLIVYLRRHLAEPDSVVFAIPNLARSQQQTFALIADGMLPGIPDVCVVTRDVRGARWAGFIEAKAPDGGRLSDAQKHVQAQIRALGFPVLAECRSVQAAVDWLSEHGVAFR